MTKKRSPDFSGKRKIFAHPPLSKCPPYGTDRTLAKSIGSVRTVLLSLSGGSPRDRVGNPKTPDINKDRLVDERPSQSRKAVILVIGCKVLKKGRAKFIHAKFPIFVDIYQLKSPSSDAGMILNIPICQ